MFQKFRKYFPGGLLLLMAPLLLTGETVPAPVSKYYPVRFEDAKFSSRARTIVLVNMLRNDVMQCLPARHKGAAPYRISIDYEKGDPARLFSIRKIRPGVCKITLPENFEDLLALPDALPTLTAWILAASAGHDPALADPIINSWYVTGIARRLLRNISPVKSPFPQYFPSAYVLTSHGMYPTLESLLNQELTREDSCARLLYEEYSELLVMICSRQGLFRKGLISTLLEKTFQDPDRRDTASLFQDFVYSNPGRKEKHLFKTAAGEEKNSKLTLENWFRLETEKILNWIFLPCAASKLEKLYLQAGHFESPAKKGPRSAKTEKKSGEEKERSSGVKMIRGTLTELPELYRSLANPADPAVKMALAVGRAARFASPDLLPALLEVRGALLAFAQKQAPETGKRLLDADKKFFRALERNILLERFLEETERKALVPGTRYYVTMTLLERYHKSDLPVIARLEEFLRRTTQGKVHLP